MERLQARRVILATAAIIAGVFFDRWAKWAALNHWSTQPFHIFPGAQLIFLLNRGSVFSIPLHGAVAIIISLVILAALLVWYVGALRHRQVFRILGLTAILIGAGSNLVDRFLYGGVVDYVAISILPVFNIADLLILTGALLLLKRHHT